MPVPNPKLNHHPRDDKDNSNDDDDNPRLRTKRRQEMTIHARLQALVDASIPLRVTDVRFSDDRARVVVFVQGVGPDNLATQLAAQTVTLCATECGYRDVDVRVATHGNAAAARAFLGT